MQAEPSAIPPDFVCPLTQRIMREPAIAADGVSYEWEAIEALLKKQGNSPQTGKPFEHKVLRTDWQRWQRIKQYLNQHPSLQNSPHLYLPQCWIRKLVAALKANRADKVKHWFTKDLRLLTQPLEGDYRAFHLAAVYGSAEFTEAVWKQLQSQDQTATCFPQPQFFKPVHLNTLLSQALMRNDSTQAEQWWTLGAELEHSDSSGNSLLVQCVCRGDVLSVQWLLAKGASLTACNPEGNTPLHLSLLHHQPVLTALLLEHQADPRLRNREGQRSWDIAENLQSEDGLIRLWLASQIAPLAVVSQADTPSFLPAYTHHAGIQPQSKPFDAGVYHRLGLDFYHKGLYAKALVFFLVLGHPKQFPYYPKACLKLWRIYRCGNGVVSDETKSDGYGQQVAAHVPWFRAQAATGDPEADYNLGELYAGGLGVPVDAVKAYHCYKRAAEQGHCLAQFKLGYCYREGQGVEPDDREAKAWFRKAALQGNVLAQHDLGMVYASDSQDTSYQRALFWYEQAARQGYAAAQCSLATLYAQGVSGVLQDHHQARFWYEQAAAQEDLEAQYALGLFDEQGWGGVQDQDHAEMWYGRAATQGHAEALSRLLILRGRSAPNPPVGDQSYPSVRVQPASVAEPSAPCLEDTRRTTKRPRLS